MAAEVLKLRDHIVHPKPKPGVLASESVALFVDYGATNTLRVPFDTREWSSDVAKLVVTTVFAFMKKFFLEWCSLDKNHITTLLVSREKALIQGLRPSWVTMPRGDIDLVQNYLPEAFDLFDLRVNE